MRAFPRTCGHSEVVINFVYSHDLNTGLWLVETDHVTWILTCYWFTVLNFYVPTLGYTECTGRQCAKCPYTPPTASSVTSHITGYTHHITTPIICTTENTIYLWKCTKCKINFSINKRNETLICPKAKADLIGSLYTSRTKWFFKTRLGEHLGYIGNENSEEPSRLHFSLPGHSKHDLQGLAIEQVRSKDPFVIKAREHKYIQLFDSYRRGLNQEP